MDLVSAKKLLPEARELSGFASEAWSESYDTVESRAEVCVVDQLTGEITPIAAILKNCSFEDRQLMFRAPVLLRAVLTLLDEAFKIIREGTIRRRHGRHGAHPCRHSQGLASQVAYRTQRQSRSCGPLAKLAC